MNDNAEITFRPAAPEDASSLAPMLPQLADFDIPSNRQPKQLWTGDLKLLNAILAGEKPNAFIELAVDTKQPQTPLGLAMISLGEELFNHEPSAHLEALVVDAQARGLGIGRGEAAANTALAGLTSGEWCRSGAIVASSA